MSTTEANATIFDLLPGQVMQVSEFSPILSKMWSVAMEPGQKPPSEFRASQMNVVLHMGLRTPPEEAHERFQTVIEFAQKYPCRIIVLCPMGREHSDRLLQGKLFSQCYIGDDLRDMCCIEAIIVGYPTREAGFLSNSVSVWLENDLPTYHWFNRVPAERIEQYHMDFVKHTSRVVYDSSIETEDFSKIPWPRAEAAKDLAHARILPVRQNIGQFLSSFAPQKLIEGLKAVTVRHNERRVGEANNLLKWASCCLETCAKSNKVELTAALTCDLSPKDSDNCLELEFSYDNESHFLWTHKTGCDVASVTADFGTGRISIPMQVSFLKGEKALSEALFFG
ncbi:glucose-6-phosphate dehydrogenase assembly protein OpcA [Rubellicoccus peritrichatus]|uniref:Glucose-6-phosphate dehydrogenase assembly protein OpcA N-terminal domain-containing protein n=1 Tax=Rubellicoccus peritrichatus TaxID=3080537 RepID=A0AAQ3LGE8_9BACT|nr:glucose-6-phosphate dehydrogenase assembly protein OpcA [Puniceicoccus sp. CR14]WOO41659.1 hypothetical protein RZN69_01065 [Puniceicoccus sp. CR14]